MPREKHHMAHGGGGRLLTSPDWSNRLTSRSWSTGPGRGGPVLESVYVHECLPAMRRGGGVVRGPTLGALLPLEPFSPEAGPSRTRSSQRAPPRHLRGSRERARHRRLRATRLTNLPGQWLQCQVNGSNVRRVLRVSHLHDRRAPCKIGYCGDRAAVGRIQGYLAYKKPPPRRTLQ